jgi:hypothetical protein
MTGQLIDDVAKALAGAPSRRQALKLITGGIAGAVMAQLGLRNAVAKTCNTGEINCPSVNDCCLSANCNQKVSPKKCCLTGIACGLGCCVGNETCTTTGADGLCKKANGSTYTPN